MRAVGRVTFREPFHGDSLQEEQDAQGPQFS